MTTKKDDATRAETVGSLLRDDAVVRAARGCHLLVNASPAVFNEIALRAALRLRAHYLDLSTHMTRRPFKAEQLAYDERFAEKKRAAVITAGVSPGLTNLLAARGDIVAAAGWLLALAEADTGPAVALRAMGLAAAMARAIPVWLEDGKDMAKTMARLDGDLGRIGNFLDRRNSRNS